MEHKLINLNIEINQNIDKIEAMLLVENPDIFCVQEITKCLFGKWKRKFFTDAVFSPMTPPDSQLYGQWGLAIFSKYKITSNKSIVYDNFSKDYKEQKEFRSERPIATVLFTGFKELNGLKIATTHFTWSPDAKASFQQRINLESLLASLESHTNYILCGDFNAPRGREIFSRLSSKLKDNLPSSWQTTIDPQLHKAQDLNIIVDGVFSAGSVKIKEMRQIFNVSDHSAIVAIFETE